MTTWQESSKLVELRSKTDRQLLELVTRTLEAARCFARTDEFHGRAQRAIDEVRRLMPLLPRTEVRRVESRVEEIADAINPRAQAVCF